MQNHIPCVPKIVALRIENIDMQNFLVLSLSMLQNSTKMSEKFKAQTKANMWEPLQIHESARKYKSAYEYGSVQVCGPESVTHSVCNIFLQCTQNRRKIWIIFLISNYTISVVQNFFFNLKLVLRLLGSIIYFAKFWLLFKESSVVKCRIVDLYLAWH